MADPTIDQNQLAAQYGFAMAVLNGNPELKSIFEQAVAGTWTPDRFQAAVRATGWYQKTEENQRNAQILQASDPATYAANVEKVRVKVAMMAAEMGANTATLRLGQGDLGGTANHFYTFGYDDNQIRQFLSKYVQYTDGRLLGQAGQWETQLRQYAQEMGVSLSNDTILRYVKAAESGTQTINDQMNKIRSVAASAFPHLAERLAAGETLSDIASPYQQAMASTLELNSQGISLTDPLIQKALSSPDQTGKPVMQTLYDFQTGLRKDPRWLKTQNAQDSAMETTRKVLTDFGLVAS